MLHRLFSLAVVLILVAVVLAVLVVLVLAVLVVLVLVVLIVLVLVVLIVLVLILVLFADHNTCPPKFVLAVLPRTYLSP